MEFNFETILENIFAGVGVALITTALSLILAILTYIRHKLVNLKSKRTQEYGGLLLDFAEKAVKTVAQVEGDAIKVAAEDGKFTDEEKEHLKETAVTTLKAIAPDYLMKFMAKINSDLEAYLGVLIESAVRDNSGGNGS